MLCHYFLNNHGDLSYVENVLTFLKVSSEKFERINCVQGNEKHLKDLVYLLQDLEKSIRNLETFGIRISPSDENAKINYKCFKKKCSNAITVWVR